MASVWISGAGMTPFGRRTQSLPDLMADAARAALTASGIEVPDAIVVAAMNPEEFLGEGNFASRIATHLGFAYVPAIRVETATSSGAAAIFAGFTAVASGTARAVLVVGGERMTHLPTPRVSEIIGRSIDPYERSYGATMPALAGLITRALMARSGLSARGREEPRQRRAEPVRALPRAGDARRRDGEPARRGPPPPLPLLPHL